MMSISICVNGKRIRYLTARRIKGEEHERCTYKTGHGTIIEHDYDDGLEMLSMRLIQDFIFTSKKGESIQNWKDKMLRSIAKLPVHFCIDDPVDDQVEWVDKKEIIKILENRR